MQIKNYKDLFALDGAWRAKRAEKGLFYTDKSLKTRDAVMRNYIIPLWGHYHLKRLTVKIIDKEMQGITSKWTNRRLSGETRNRILGVLSEVYVHVIGEGKLNYNPVRDVVRCSSKPEHPRGAISTAEIEKLFPGVRREIQQRILFPDTHERLLKIWRTQKYVCAFLILKDTGLRPGELLALKWRDWNSQIKFFPILKAIESGTRNKEKSTKTGSVKPAIISDRTAQEIETLKRKINPCRNDYIFSNYKNVPYDPHRLCWNFHAAVQRAGIDRTELSPYYLRHTFNTRMLERLDDKTVGHLMGHQTEEMRRRYRHADAESLAREAALIKDAVNEARLF